MGDAYDRGRTAALVDEARKLKAALKIEAEETKTIIDKALATMRMLSMRDMS